VERLDDLDSAVLVRLGSAVARVHLLELAMAKLLKAHGHDMSVPIDDRWDEISGRLRQTAGDASQRAWCAPTGP
jgi:hypothetical protein